MKRITPDEVVAAYAKIGAKPVQRMFYDSGQFGEPDCCCGLAAVIVAGNCGIHPPSFLDAAFAMCGDDCYVGGFVSGFDGGARDLSRYYEENHPRHALGYTDGRAAAIAVGLIQEGANT